MVSDATGDTATSVVRAAMAQFQVESQLRTVARVRSSEEARRVAVEAERAGAVVVFTLVDRRVAQSLLEEASKRGVPTVDLLGPLIAQVADHLQAQPRAQPGLLYGFSDDYYRRIEAVEFAVRHDDGANLRTLFAADVVLTGVSRTSKTPLSMYLAQRGYRTGNVPLVRGVDPPRELLELDPRKVFGLNVDPDVLLTVRESRIRALGASPYSSYVDPDAVLEEIRTARRLFRRSGWRVVDISRRAVEENASRILEFLESDRNARA